jgi:aminocarboxymuconate-semialdehyde decarboxylase
MKLDIFNHFSPVAYYERLCGLAPDNPGLNAFRKLPALWDLDERLRLLDRYDDYQQVLSLANPPVELIAGPDQSPALVRFGNEELAKVCTAHPDRFPAFIANLPMNNPEAAAREARFAVEELGARGIQLFTNVNGRPLSEPEFYPIFETMAGYDLPIWVHPMRGPHMSDYAAEALSQHEIWFTFGWPYETSACMARLIFSGLFDKLPNLKVISHHMGGMIPYFADKIGLGFQQIFFGRPDFNPVAAQAGLARQPLEYFHKLYGDTALNGSAAATRCGLDFFGVPHALFATDAPFDSLGGRQMIERTIEVIDALDLSPQDRDAVYSGNARKLLKLSEAP